MNPEPLLCKTSTKKNFPRVTKLIQTGSSPLQTCASIQLRDGRIQFRNPSRTPRCVVSWSLTICGIS